MQVCDNLSFVCVCFLLASVRWTFRTTKWNWRKTVSKQFAKNCFVSVSFRCADGLTFMPAHHYNAVAVQTDRTN